MLNNSDKTNRNILALILAVIAGILLIVSGLSGSTGVWGYILNLIITEIGGDVALIAGYILTALSILANLGGITVIISGILYYLRRVTLGRLLSSLGAGMGFIGFIILYVASVVNGWSYLITITAQLFTTIGGVGIVFSIIAGLTAKKH
ncbi:MAG: hypothetical protein ACTSYQ_00160 [Candidatus Odinarchaeia archaeon]